MQIDSTSYRSGNYDQRPAGTAIDAIVLHTGEGTKQSDLYTLTSSSTNVSAHYYVDRAGHVYELVSPKERAWHAGVSAYVGRTSWNNFAIGIESEHKQGQDWPSVQRAAYADLCKYLIARYPIEQRYVAAHRWIAPSRRSDPTDWPDGALSLWIAQLFADVWALRWGDIATPSGDQWGWANVMAWKANWQRLGFCRSHLLYDNANSVAMQVFTGGDVRLFDNVAEVAFR